jgi:hypothetical protein
MKILTTTNKNLLFTCTGDKKDYVKLWLNNDKNFDIFVNYYGDKDIKNLNYINNVNGFSMNKGWKYNILNILHKNKKIDLLKYEYVAVFGLSFLAISGKNLFVFVLLLALLSKQIPEKLLKFYGNLSIECNFWIHVNNDFSHGLPPAQVKTVLIE